MTSRRSHRAFPRAVPALLMVALVLPLVAGCLAGTPTEPAGATGPDGDDDAHTVTLDYGPLPSGYTLDRIEPFEVEADDGTVLRGHVYFPNGSGPFATILNYAPYWNGAFSGESEEAATADGTSMQGRYGRLLEAGFAVALINIRGTGESDGCNPWMDFEQDGADAYHVIEMLANASWSNGNVGMMGGSWHGYTQYAALVDQPPSLKAVAPTSAVLDAWELFTRRGPTIISQFGPMATTYVVFQAGVAGTPNNFPANRAQCPEHVEQVQALNELTITGDKTDWWQRRMAHEYIAASDVPMFVTNGLTKFSEGHALQIEGIWPLMNADSRLMLGQWGHGYPDDDRSEWYSETLVAWFDHYLRDGPKLVDTGFVEYQDNTDEWHTSPTWPPATANATRIYLSDGAVVDGPDAVAASEQTFLADDLDHRPTDCGGNKALYVSPPLAEDVLLAGNFSTNITLTSTLPNTNVGVFVWHVDELYSCTDPAPHAQGISYPDEVSRALSDLRHRGHLEQGEDFPVGEPGVMSMLSHPFATRVEAGERLVVGVTGGAIELAVKDPDAVLTVQTGEGIEGWLDLPVVEGRLVFEGDEGGQGAAWTAIGPSADRVDLPSRSGT